MTLLLSLSVTQFKVIHDYPCHYRCVPESVRWLRVNERVDEAEAILRKVAKTNGKAQPTVKLSAAEKDTAHGTYADLFRPASTCRDTLVQSFAW